MRFCITRVVFIVEVIITCTFGAVDLKVPSVEGFSPLNAILNLLVNLCAVDLKLTKNYD